MSQQAHWEGTREKKTNSLCLFTKPISFPLGRVARLHFPGFLAGFGNVTEFGPGNVGKSEVQSLMDLHMPSLPQSTSQMKTPGRPGNPVWMVKPP